MAAAAILGSESIGLFRSDQAARIGAGTTEVRR